MSGPVANNTLTAMQEAYAASLAAGLSEIDAYRQSHPNDTSVPSTMYANASRLAADSRVVTRVQQLKAAALAKTTKAQAWNLDRIVGEAEEQLRLARTGGYRSVAAGNGALELIARLKGLLDKKGQDAGTNIQIVFITDGQPDRVLTTQGPPPNKVVEGVKLGDGVTPGVETSVEAPQIEP